jgi:predicted nucleic acid-binding protein
MRYHIDNDVLVHACAAASPERRRLLALVDAVGVDLGMSAVAWYEFCRGPRTAEQLALARAFLGDEGIAPFDDLAATRSGDVFRLLGSPRQRGSDIAIGVTAVLAEAVLLTRNRQDFADIPDLVVEVIEEPSPPARPRTVARPRRR